MALPIWDSQSDNFYPSNYYSPPKTYLNSLTFPPEIYFVTRVILFENKATANLAKGGDTCMAP